MVEERTEKYLMDKIFPAALFHTNDIPKELTVADFQKLLYKWYEKQGLLNNLRAHLRTQMVSALKDTSIEQCFISKNTSPKMQAFNLLVAEFLMIYNYHYSLSVFSTEVPFSNVIDIEKKNQKNRAFDEKDAKDILNTVGIPHHSPQENLIIKKYFINENEPLLINIFKCLTEKTDELFSLENIDTLINELNNNYDLSSWENALTNLFLNCGFNNSRTDKLVFLITSMFEKEKKKIEEVFTSQLETLKNEFKEKEEKLAAEFKEKQLQLENEFKSVKNKLNNVRQKELQTLHRHISKLSQFENKLKIQQKEFLHEHQMLEMSRKNLEEEKKSVQKCKEKLIEEKKNIVKLRTVLENESRLSPRIPASHANILLTPNYSGDTECITTNNRANPQKVNIFTQPNEMNNKNNEANDKINNLEQQQLIRNLQFENKILQKQITDQKEKIQELSLKFTELILNTKGIEEINKSSANRNDNSKDQEHSNANEKVLKNLYVSKNYEVGGFEEEDSEKVVKDAKEYLKQIKSDNNSLTKYCKQIQSLFSRK